MGASVPLLWDAPTISVLGDTEELAYGRCRFLGLGVAESKVVEDPPDRHLLSRECDHAHALAATSAHQWVDLVDLRDQPSPVRRRAPARLVLLAGLRGGLGGLTAAPDAVRVPAVEERAVLPRVGDVVGETSEPVERVITSKFRPREGFMRER